MLDCPRVEVDWFFLLPILPAHKLIVPWTIVLAGHVAWTNHASKLQARPSTISADSFRRLLETYLFARYYCIQRVRGSWR